MLKACEKRPISFNQLESITDRIETQINEMFEREVGAKMIGHMVMDELNRLDPVAYVRFASVYREFKDVHEFVEEVQPLLQNRLPGDPPPNALHTDPAVHRTEEAAGAAGAAGAAEEAEFQVEDRT